MGSIVNAILVIGKFVAGIWGHSSAMIADAVHSLSDFLTDQKLTLFEKEHQPLLMDGDEIAWVVGRRSSDLYRVDEHTKKVLQLFSE